ncbi:mucin-7-like [Macrobrachium rosenbergii]|uniref:mucin-7-like n=1 Tax=Macrobrachium rosenbergii TaxID=79674 RepID=UPI0034D72DFF
MIRLPLLSAIVLSVIWTRIGAYPSLTAPPEIAALCPNPPGEYPLLISNPADCRSFYMCSWDNMAFLQHCPPVLYFNPSLQVCDSPANVDCSISTTASPVAPNTTVAEKTATSPVPISNSTSLEYPTPPVPLEPVTAPPSVAALCPNPPQEFPLLLANPVDCNSFFMCSWNGVAYLQNCPANLHFNPELQVCDFPSSFRCSVSTTPPPFTNSSTSAPATNSSTSTPEIKTTAAPVTNSSISTPEIKTTAVPVTNSSTSTPEIKTTAAPITNSSTSAPEIKTTAAPVTNSSTSAPEIKTTAVPVTNSSTSTPEIKTTAAPITNSSTSAPEIKTTAAPVTNSTSAPEIKTTAAPVSSEIKTTAVLLLFLKSRPQTLLPMAHSAPEIKTTAAPVSGRTSARNQNHSTCHQYQHFCSRNQNHSSTLLPMAALLLQKSKPQQHLSPISEIKTTAAPPTTVPEIKNHSSTGHQ